VVGVATAWSAPRVDGGGGRYRRCGRCGESHHGADARCHRNTVAPRGLEAPLAGRRCGRVVVGHSLALAHLDVGDAAVGADREHERDDHILGERRSGPRSGGVVESAWGLDVGTESESGGENQAHSEQAGGGEMAHS
jgi:hypothetical protein